MDINHVLLQILGGTIASLIAIAMLAIGRRAEEKLSNRRLKAVLGFSRGICRVVAPASRLPDKEGYVHHLDTYALAYCMSLTRPLDVEAEIISERKISETAEPSNEFCVAGAPSNLRTRELLKLYCPGFGLIMANDQPENFCIGSLEFAKETDVEHCFLAKITTAVNTKVHLVFGISGSGTAGAAYYLFKNYEELFRKFGNDDYFVRLSFNSVEGFKSAPDFKDVSEEVFRGERMEKSLWCS